jgi:O-antigen/teichoic acid export membrane protein
MLNAELVGYYTFAVSFCSLLSFFESSSHGVVFPAFVKLKHDKIKVSFLYKYATFLLSVFEILIYFSLICNIDWILPLILDVKKWKPVISILKWLALSSIINPFGIYFMSLMQAYKKDKKMTIYSVSFVIIKIVLAYIMLLNFRTVESIIWSKIFETFLGLIVCFYMISKLIGYKNMIVKEYIYQFILIILFTLLYFFTNHPIARFFGTFFIVLFFMVLFYFITIKPKLPLFIRLLKSK